jgi:hypothetical protein
MATLHNDVLDAALSYISTNGLKAEIVTSASAVLVGSIVLDSGNYTGPVDNSGSGAGRKLTAMVSDSSDMKSISVNSAGSADHVNIVEVSGSAATNIVQASITSAPVVLGSADKVNITAFSIILKDPS